MGGDVKAARIRAHIAAIAPRLMIGVWAVIVLLAALGGVRGLGDILSCGRTLHIIVVDVGMGLLALILLITALVAIKHLRRNQQQLRLLEERYRRLAENSPDVIYRMSLPDGRYEYISPSAIQVFGHSPEEMYTWPLLIRDIIHPDWRDYFTEQWAKWLKGEAPPTYEYQIVHPSGETRWLNQRNMLVRDEAGRAVAIEGVVTDVTDRKRAEIEIVHLNAVLRAIRNVNQLITREKDRGALLQGACDALIETRGYYSAWIGLLGADGRVVAVAAAGLGETRAGLPAQLASGDPPACVRLALAQAEPVLLLDPPAACGDCAVAAVHREDSSVMAIRLEYAGQVYGLLVVALPREYSGDQEEHLFREVAGDLSFALHNIELEQMQRRAEENLRASEARYRTLVEGAGQPVFTVDRNGVFGFMNRIAAAALGGQPEDFVGKAMRDLFPPAVAEEQLANIARAIETGQSLEIENESEIQGQKRWYLALIHPIRNEAGEIESALVMAQDIHERRQAVTALRESEERYRALVENAPLGILSIDAEGRILNANPALIEIMGSPSTEATLQINVLTFEPLVASGVASDFRACLETGKTFISERPYVSKWGKPSQLRYHGSALRDSEGKIIGVQALVEDMTAYRQIEEQLRQAQKMEAIGRLAGGVAHDFNNLLTVINGYSQFIIEDLPPADPIRPQIEEIRQAGERAAKLTQQLLAFSRRQMFEMRTVNLNQVLEGMGVMLGRLIGEDIRLALKLAPDLGNVRADPGQIEQVIVNLAVNSRAAMPTGGALAIETSNVTLDEPYTHRHGDTAPGRYVQLAISDTGCGMTAEIQEHLFAPFFTTKEKGKGTGLGLSTVYGIVKQSGGSIYVYSEPGRGTTFKIYLPRIDEELEDERAGRAESPRGRETILLVEDEVGVRNLAVQILQRLGYTVLQAANGVEALGVCREHCRELDLLLTDVVMPEMSGKELVERLRVMCPALKVLYMSGYTDEALGHHGALESGVMLLQKPFTSAQLAQRVRLALDH